MIARSANRRAGCWGMVLAGIVATLSGCAAVNPGAPCQCPKCEGQPLDDQQVVIDFQEGFRKYVVGTDFEEDTPRAEPKPRPRRRQVARRNPAAEEPSIRTVSETAEVEAAPKLEVAQIPVPPARPIPPSGQSIHAAPMEGVAPAACQLGPCPPVVAPPPRFFPVPARPVFSPQPMPYGYSASGNLEPIPMSNWGESTDASL